MPHKTGYTEANKTKKHSGSKTLVQKLRETRGLMLTWEHSCSVQHPEDMENPSPQTIWCACVYVYTQMYVYMDVNVG